MQRNRYRTPHGFFPDHHLEEATLVGQVIKNRRWTLRVLWYVHWKWYLTSNQRLPFFIYQYSLLHPFLDVTLFGPGFPGWSDSLSLADNIEQKYGFDKFDAFFHEFIYSGELGYRTDFRDLSIRTKRAGSKMLMMRFHHECRPDVAPCTDLLSRDLVDIGFYASAFDVVDADAATYWPHRRLLAHLPVLIGTSPDFFTGNAADDAERPFDVLITGVHMELYPLRLRFFNLFSESHVTDSLQVKILLRQDGVSAFDSVHTFAKSLRSSKIMLMDASAFRYPLLKYAEAACSGALIVGEIPAESFSTELSQFVVPISPHDSDQRILSIVRWWIDHPKERHERALRGQQFCRKHFHVVHALENILNAVEMFEDGETGLVFPYGFHRGCRRCSSGGVHLAGRNQFCQGGHVCT
jgi:hypothetical protein